MNRLFSFVSRVSYKGDRALYKNTVTTDDGDILPLATNLVLSVGKHTQIYFRLTKAEAPAYYEELSKADSGWIYLDVENGDTIAKALREYTTDVYTIFELDENGVHRYDVYIDKTAPELKLRISGDQEIDLKDDSNPQINGTSVEFLSLTDKFDKQAYVGLFTYSGQFIEAHYASDIAEFGKIEQGNYQLQVGDRSGNILVYKMFVSSVPLVVTIEESELTDGVTVLIKGRTKDEITRYEVYLNNEIETSTLPTSTVVSSTIRQTFHKPGIYYVIVQDKYGNKATVEYTYQRPVPVVKWSYQAGERFDDYDEKNIVCMNIIENHTAVYDVYTSTFVR
ncbi:MAG: hypothetical protein MJ072_07205, partial [Clostridia bacterium]|nr:hypothetical protein [Clostridia bacterium]